MNSSRPKVDRRDGRPATPQLAADGGVGVECRDLRDPFAALDDLMVVVEALCPRWPPREAFGPMLDLLL